MMIKLDTENKTITLLEDVKLKLFLSEIKKLVKIYKGWTIKIPSTNSSCCKEEKDSMRKAILDNIPVKHISPFTPPFNTPVYSKPEPCTLLQPKPNTNE